MDLRSKKKRQMLIIPIVPLVDILVVLLMFFIATTTFKSKTDKAHHLQVSLPQSNALGTAAPKKEARKTLAITKEKKIYLDNNEVGAEGLAAALKEMKTALPDAKLELQADQDTSLGLLVTVWDALKSAGWSINDVPARIQRAAQQGLRQ
ncbi:MAG TPA: biopolymer transporter ExbD [Verrucomicrobiaceae bacterium]|jgi:biopolymer transport protein ExbD